MKSSAKIKIYLLILIVLNSCVSQPKVTEPEPVQITEVLAVYIPPLPVIIPEVIIPEIIPPLPLTPEERLIERIRENGDDIVKFFLVDRNDRITIKAELIHNNQKFEIIYDLENLIELESSVYEVEFTVRLMETIKNDDQEDYSEQPEIPEYMESKLIWKPVPGNAGLLLSFDDDYQDTWEQYLDFFDEYEAKVTFFLFGEFHPFSLIAMERGHDIGFHTLTHPDLRPLSRTAFNMETSEAAQSFRQKGVPVTGFAYPYGFSYDWMHTALFEHFTVVRGYDTGFRLYDKNTIRHSYIISRAIDNTILQRDEYFDYIIKMMLRTAKFMDRNWVLPITSHNISNGSWAIRHNRLEFLLQTAVDLRLKFYKYSDF